MADKVIDKLYSKEDIRLELGLTSHIFNKRMDTVIKLFKIDMKKFHNFKGQEKNNQYTFNGVAKELLVVLLKGVAYYPIDINSKKFKTQTKKEIIEGIESTDYTLYITKILEAIDEIKYKRLIAYIKISDVFQKTQAWFNISNTFREKEQEIYHFMETLPLNKRVDLQNEILKSIDETMFKFMAKEEKNRQIKRQKLLEKYKKAIISGKNPKNDYELNYQIYKESLFPLDTVMKDMWDFEKTEYEELDWFIADMLNHSQRASGKYTETIDKNNQLKNSIRKKAGKNLGRIMDHQLVKSGKKWDIIESYEKHKNWMNSRLIEKNKCPSVLYYSKSNTSLKYQLDIVKKIKIIEAHLKKANKLPDYVPLLLQAKFDLEKLHSELIKYRIDLNYIDKLDKKYADYIIEDIQFTISIIDQYLSKDVVRKTYPKLQMVIRNDIKDHGKLFINKMKEVKRKTSNDINNNYEDLLINPLVEEFINSLKNRRFNTK